MDTFRLHSHPSPEGTLFRHLQTVGKSCKEHIDNYKHYHFSKSNFENIKNCIYIIGVTHDFAKATSFFQKMLYNEQNKSVYSTHSALSALFTFFVCSKIIQDNQALQGLSYIVVKRHHGHLRNIWDVEAIEDNFNFDVILKQMQDIITIDSKGFRPLEELKKIYEILLPSINLDEFFSIDVHSLVGKIRRSLKKLVIEESLYNYFLLLSLYSILQISDKTDAGNLPSPPRINELFPDIVFKYRQDNFHPTSNTISKVRDEAFNGIIENISKIDISENRLFSITLPTGYGKTIAGLAAALLIRQRIQDHGQYRPRIIYSLPFLSIIDQNSQVFKKILTIKHNDINNIPSNLLIVHHHLSDFTYKFRNQNLESINDGDEFETIAYRSSLFLTEGWNSEIVITTFVQLFHSIITNNKNMLRKFNNISGSVIILDEIQAIPPKYWNVIEESLNYICRELGCWLIFMTATKPALFKSSIELSSNTYQHDPRVQYKVTKEHSLDSLGDSVLEQVKSKNKILAVLNTIGSSKNLYENIKCKLTLDYGEPKIDELGICSFGNIKLIYLSTYVLPHIRLKRISYIKDKRTDSNNEPQKMIVISTQVVEAGVDIDMECVFRDFAPLDSIIQCAGRCNRNGFNESLGDVILLDLIDEMNNDRHFCSYIYDNILLGITCNILREYPEDTFINEKEILNKIDFYFQKVRDYKKNEPFINDMKNLHFDKVKDFELIDNYNSIQVFVEFDENAMTTRQKISNKELPDKIKFLPDIKYSLNNYTLNIRKPKEIEVAGLLPLIEGTEIRYIPNAILQTWYNMETGIDLKLERSIEMQII